MINSDVGRILQVFQEYLFASGWNYSFCLSQLCLRQCHTPGLPTFVWLGVFLNASLCKSSPLSKQFSPYQWRLWSRSGGICVGHSYNLCLVRRVDIWKSLKATCWSSVGRMNCCCDACCLKHTHF